MPRIPKYNLILLVISISWIFQTAFTTTAFAKNYQEACSNDTSVCSFYCQAAEALQCEPNNYLLSFGYRYCAKFLQKNDHFTTHGQFVLDNIRNCLIDSLKDEPNLTCENVKSTALESHVACYRDNDFCTLKLKDRMKIFWIIRAQVIHKDFKNIMGRINDLCKK